MGERRDRGGNAAGSLLLTPPEQRPQPGLYAVGSTVFFTAYDDDHGPRLWKSDGTVEGTVPLLGLSVGGLREAASFHGRFFFVTRSAAGEEGLWASDGTPAGTVLVKEVGADQEAVQSSLMKETAGRLWFFAADEEHGLELWSSDGTAGGTALAVELAPGFDSFRSLSMAVANGRLFFGGGAAGESGLWVSDGTAAGTERIGPAPIDRDFFHDKAPAVLEGVLFYPAIDGTLWRSDGTAAGTRAMQDQDGGAVTGQFLQVLGDRLYFTRAIPERQLWVSDGTDAGTRRVQGAPPAGILVRAGQRLFFPSEDPIAGSELWALSPPVL